MEIGPTTRVVVTGASRGIGRATAVAFAEAGAEVGLLARSEEELNELVLALPGDGHEAIAADVGDREGLHKAIAEFGPVDVVVANAGVAHYGPFRDMDLDEIDRMTRVNWLGTVNTVTATLPGMLDRARGHVVIVSSGAGVRSFPWAAVYGATKSAQRGFAEALRHELSGTGVSLTTVYPGEVKSHLHDHEQERMPDWYRGKEKAAPAEPLGRAIVDAVRARPARRLLPAARAPAARRPRHLAASLRPHAAHDARRDRGAAHGLSRGMALPLSPPLKPQLARPAKELPEGDDWRYEPKWDGFRTIVFRDGDDVYLQSRNGKPMNRYFPEIPPQVMGLDADRVVLDGELILVVDGIQEFDLLGQRIHPAKSRVEMLAKEYPGRLRRVRPAGRRRRVAAGAALHRAPSTARGGRAGAARPSSSRR